MLGLHRVTSPRFTNSLSRLFVAISVYMSSMEKMQWEALPARRRKTGDVAQPTPVVRKQVAGYQQILDNIAARKQQHNSNISTLLSQDGCAGAFYEYLDHTADVQCHAWGADMKAAFENMAPCMLNYMTDLALISIDESKSTHLEVTGHDLQSLLYNYMNELLFKFSTDSFVTVKSEISKFDREHWSINATLRGEIFDPSRHSSGTEIKAITYSNMQIHEDPDRVDLYVIVDI